MRTMKRCSISLSIRKCKSKPQRGHLTPARRAVIKKTRDKGWEDVKQREPLNMDGGANYYYSGSHITIYKYINMLYT